MQLNRYILASKAHVKCMCAWLNSCRQRSLYTVYIRVAKSLLPAWP